MKICSYIFVMLFSCQLLGQTDSFKIDFPYKNSRTEFYTFVNTETDEIYSLSLSNNLSTHPGLLWSVNRKTKEVQSKKIPLHQISNIQDVQQLFYHSKHIFCLKYINARAYLVLQPIGMETNSEFKPYFINLKSGKEKYLAARLVDNQIYVFTVSKKLKVLKIYQMDLESNQTSELEMPLNKEELSALHPEVLERKSNFTMVVDYNEFYNPIQLLVQNKIYFENGKIILLIQYKGDKIGNIFYEIDFDTKKWQRKLLPYGSASVMPFYSFYHDNYVYRVRSSADQVIVDAIGFRDGARTARYINDKKTPIPIYAKSTAREISFSSAFEFPIHVVYRNNKSFRMPFPKMYYSAVGFIEFNEDNDMFLYLGYTQSDNRAIDYDDGFYYTDTGIDAFQTFYTPSQFKYYVMETNFPIKQNDVNNEASSEFRVPSFAKIIAKCNYAPVERKRDYNPSHHKHQLKTDVDGIQIHSLEDGFYGSYFDTQSGVFYLKKLTDRE